MMELLILGGIGAYLTVQRYDVENKLREIGISESNNAANNRSRLLFDKTPRHEANREVGNWKWDQQNTKPWVTHQYFKEPTPVLAGVADWSHEGNQWMRMPGFRRCYVDNYRNALSTEHDFALRNQLVAGYWDETITKGRVLTQTTTADGAYNPNGLNLYLYHSK